ncbi:hypothetical protein ABZS29_18865 [Kribbella sp. NPDC005582]|uniref:hypothetical protein n=1 Tax=Kribbella sp. NPDC005582 TaxID=3156893 RepID=UPI0033A21F57
MSTTQNATARKPWAMWVEIALIIGALVVESFAVRAVDGVLAWALGAVGTALIIGFWWRCGVWAERVARRKNVYHPQYFVLGPFGLLAALCAKDKNPR